VKNIQIAVISEDGTPGERYVITFDEQAYPERPWFGVNVSGYGDTYRASGLERVMELIAEGIVRKEF
jgi:hypothetical protein